MKIYSLYSLYEKNNPEKIKFIGITSQTLSKRISDIIACNKKYEDEQAAKDQLAKTKN